MPFLSLSLVSPCTDLRRGSHALDQAAVHPHDRPRDVGRALACQERDDIAVFFRLAIAAERNGGRALGRDFLNRPGFAFRLSLIEVADAVGRYATRENDVCSDAILTHLPGEG